MEHIEDPAFSENTQEQSSFILLPSQEETQQESQVEKQMVKILKKLPALQKPDNPVIVVQSETSDTCTDEEHGRGNVAVLVSDTDSVGKTDVNCEPSDIGSDSDLEEDVTVIQKKSEKRTCKTKREAQKDDKSRSSSQSNGSSFNSQNGSNLGSYDQCEVYRTQKGHAKGDKFDTFPASQDMFEETGDRGCALTPSQHLGSLHLSQNPMLIPETVDESQNEIPPSPGVYGSTPLIIPSSPTQVMGNHSVQNISSDLEDKNQTVFDINAAETLASQPKDYSLQVIEDKEQIEMSKGNKEQTLQSNNKISKDDPEHGDEQSQSLGLNLSAGTLNSDGKTAEETRLKPRQVLPPPPSSQNLMVPESYGSEHDVIVIGSGSMSVNTEKRVEESDDLVLHLSVSEAGTVQGQRSQLPEGRASSISNQFIEVEKESHVKTSQKTFERRPSSQDKTSEVRRGQGSQESRSQGRGQSSGSESRSQSKKKSKMERKIEEMNDHPLVQWKNDSDVERKGEMNEKSSNRFSDEFHLAVPGLMSEPEPKVASQPGIESVQKSCSSQQSNTSQRISSQPQPAQEHLKDSVLEMKLDCVPVSEEGRDRLSIGMIQSESEHTEPVFKLQKPPMEELNLLDESEDVFPRKTLRQKGTPRLIIEDSDEGDDVNLHTGDTEKIVSTDVCDKSAGLDKTEETFIATKLDAEKMEESSELTQSYHAEVNVLTHAEHQPSEHLENTGAASAAVKTVGIVQERGLTESSTQTGDGNVNEAFKGDINIVQKVAEYLQSSYLSRSRSNSTCTDLSDLHGNGSDKGDNLVKTPHRKDKTHKLKPQTPKSPEEIKTIIGTYSDILSKSQKHKQDKMNQSSQKPNLTESDKHIVRKSVSRRLSSQSLPEDLLRSKSQTTSSINIVVTDPWMTARKTPSQSSVDIDSKSDKHSDLNTPRKKMSSACETGVTQQISESYRLENQHIGVSQENETIKEIELSYDNSNKCQNVNSSITAKKKLQLDIERKNDDNDSSNSENISCAEKLTPNKQKKPVVQISMPFLIVEKIDSSKFLNDVAKKSSSAKASPKGNENENFANKVCMSSTTSNKQNIFSIKPTEAWTVNTDKGKTAISKQETVLSGGVDIGQNRELVEEIRTVSSERDDIFAQDKEVAVSHNSQKKGKDNSSLQFVTEQTLESEISARQNNQIVKPYYFKSLRSKRKLKRRLSAEKRNSLHRQAGGNSSQVLSGVSPPSVSSRVSPQAVSGSFVASTQNFSPNHGTDPKDPFCFHGTQSQSSPVEKNTDNTDGTRGKMPASSRKRTRLLHKKSGLKKARLDTEDVENSSHNKHHVSFKTSPRISSQSSDTTVTTIGSLPSIPSTISLSSPIRETVLSPTSSSSRQSVSEEISTRLSGKRMSIEQALPDTLPLTHSEEDNYQKVTVLIEKVERVYREITTTRKVIGPEGQILENTKEVKRLDPVVVEENTHKKIQYVYLASPSRSVSSLTSGDLADVSSSLSRSSVSSGSLGSKISSLSSSLDRNPSVSTHLETQVSHEQSQADHGHGEAAKSSKPGAEKSNTGEIMAAPSSVPRTKLNRLSSGNVQENQSVAVRKAKEPHSQAVENQTNSLTGIQPHTPETLRTEYQKGHTPGLVPGIEHQSKPGTPAVQSDQEISDVQTPLGSTINKTGSYLHNRTSSVESPKTSDSLFSTSSDENKKSASNLGQGRSGDKTNDDSRPETKESGSSDQVSSDIPYQDQRVSSSQSVSPEEPVAMTTSDGNIGSRVMARWKDGFFYPGTLKSTADSHGKHLVHFDDGSKMSVKGEDILLIERLPLGQSVMVLTEEGYLESGLITKTEEDNYTVDIDEGKSRRFASSQIILSCDQAKCVISDQGKNVILSVKKPSCVPVNVGDVSLCNLVDSPRRSLRKKFVDVKVDEEGEGQSGKGRKRKYDALKPQATSTPTPKGKSESVLSKRRKILIDSPVPGIQSSPVPVAKKLPRKTRLGLSGKELGPIPTKKIFRNIYFLLTNVEKSTEQLDQEKKLIKDSSLDTSTDDSAAEEEASVPFDKEHLKLQIEAGGGIILDSFNESLVSKSKKRIVLLSSTYQRTIKYLQCLACGIPCLSHMWVVDSCTQEHLLDEKSYVLPAGISLEKKKIMEWRKKNNVFQGIKAVIFSKNSKFVDSWTQIMSLAQCHVHNEVQYSDVHVIVTDDSCTAAVQTGGENNCIPLVGTEWVIQCLVNGRLMAYKGHPRYKHDYLT